MQMVFHTSCLGRGMIEYGAEADARRGFASLVAALKRRCTTTSRASEDMSTAAPVGSTGSELAVHAAAPAAATWLGRCWTVPRAATADRSSSAAFCVAVALVLLAAAMLHASAVISTELRAVTDAIKVAKSC